AASIWGGHAGGKRRTRASWGNKDFQGDGLRELPQPAGHVFRHRAAARGAAVSVGEARRKISVFELGRGGKRGHPIGAGLDWLWHSGGRPGRVGVGKPP